MSNDTAPPTVRLPDLRARFDRARRADEHRPDDHGYALVGVGREGESVEGIPPHDPDEQAQIHQGPSVDDSSALQETTDST